MCKLGGRDHNATSYSTETRVRYAEPRSFQLGRDHNATSYSTETSGHTIETLCVSAEIITLRAIALKLFMGYPRCPNAIIIAEIITLRAIALKRREFRDHVPLKAAEIITLRAIALKLCQLTVTEPAGIAEIITLRAIALKHSRDLESLQPMHCRDHNATSYSTETLFPQRLIFRLLQRS